MEAENKKNALKVTCSLAVKLAACQEAVRYSLGQSRKGKTSSTEVGYLYSGKEGRQSAKDQAEHQDGSGRLHIYREVCGSDKGNVNQAGYFEYSLVEIAFVVGQGVISLLGRCRGWKISGQGVISPR